MTRIEIPSRQVQPIWAAERRSRDILAVVNRIHTQLNFRFPPFRFGQVIGMGALEGTFYCDIVVSHAYWC